MAHCDTPSIDSHLGLVAVVKLNTETGLNT